MGGVTIDHLYLEQDTDIYELQNKLEKETLKWDDHTQLLSDFNANIDGSNFEGNFSKIKYFNVYKQIDGKSKLHKIFSTQNNNQCIIEDFAVGDKCDYTYYIYPVCDDGSGGEYSGTPLVTNTLKINHGTVSIIGLVETDNRNIYNIDINNIWNFNLNVDNKTVELNLNKSFQEDGFNRYPKEVGGNLGYITESISGLVGKYDCRQNTYTEHFGDMDDWENFAYSNSLKLLKDSHGRLIPCTITSSSFDYGTSVIGEVTVSFSIKQLCSINDISVYANGLRINPLKNQYLADVYKRKLLDKNNKFLVTPIKNKE